jgi:hypothetical protein
VQAGRSAAVPIPLQVTNPFAQAVSVKLTLESAAGAETKTLRLAPGKAATHTFVFAPRRRSAEPIGVELSAEFQAVASDGAGQVIGRSTEHRDFLAANPLTLSVAPVGQGLRLTVHNPTRSRFEGTALLDNAKFPVRLGPDAPESILHAPGAATSVTAQLLESDGTLAADPIARQFRPLSPATLKAQLEGDAKVPASATLVETNAPGGPDRPFSQAYRLDYRFASGWRFVQCMPAGRDPILIDSSSRALGLWIYGDNSGNALRLRVIDARGQTFQPSGPRLDWTGWRWVEFDLADWSKAGHWGGANDGVPQHPLRLDTLLLVDGPRAPTAGTVYFAGPTLISSAVRK